jgi:hypothetical protein
MPSTMKSCYMLAPADRGPQLAPVFNTGIHAVYGISGPSQGTTSSIRTRARSNNPPAPTNGPSPRLLILSVEDDL